MSAPPATAAVDATTDPEDRAQRRPLATYWPAVPVLAALVLWLVSLPFVNTAKISGWGLLTAVPFTWYVALGLCVFGSIGSVLRRPLSGAVFWGYEAVLALVLFGTTSAVYEIPRYPWTFKHIGVVEQLLSSQVLSNGYLNRAIDIYHNWPGFFLLAAAFSTLTHVSPLDVARWAEPVFAFAAGLGIAYALGAITRDRRRIQLAALLFMLTNWIGSNYYSPQALATVLASVFLGIVLRTMPLPDGNGGFLLRRVPAWILRGRRVVGLADTSDQFISRHRVLGLLVATGLWAALVVTHQLTPVALALQLGALFVVTRLRSWWLLLVWGAIEGAWVATALPALNHKFSLFESDAIADFTWPGVALDPSLPGMRVVGSTGPLLEVLMPVTALLVAAWLLWRRRELHLMALMLGFAPPFLLLVQTYGGEAVFRVYLYGLPWFSSLIALALLRLWSGGWVRRGAVLVATIVLALLTTGANFGQELISYVQPADLAASVWYETHTPDDSQAVSLTALGFPAQVTEHYPGHTSIVPTVSDFTGRRPLDDGPQAALDSAVTILENTGRRTGYVCVDNASQVYARMYGLATPQQLEQFFAYVRAGVPGWTVVYDQQGVLIARYTAS